MRTPLLIFDLMDTVVVDPFFQIFPSFFGMTLTELGKIKDPDSWLKFELGIIDETEYFKTFFRPDCNHSLKDPVALKNAIFDAYRYTDGMETLLEQLRERHARLWVHSNYTPWVAQVRARLRLDRFFQGYAMSYELAARKPDSAAYQGALALMGENAQDCLFIDDREINVAGARAAGMQTVRFENVAQLRAALAQHGIPF
jgi:putative hydrolase of the HAD superfamily